MYKILLISGIILVIGSVIAIIIYFTTRSGHSPTPTPRPSKSPTPTPRPSKSPTPTPSYSPTPTPSYSPTPTPSYSPTPTPSYSPTPTPSYSPTPTPSYSPTPTPSYSPTPTPSYSPTPTPSYSPTPTPSYSPTPTPSYSPTPTPSYSPTPTPSKRPTPSDNSLCPESYNIPLDHGYASITQYDFQKDGGTWNANSLIPSKYTGAAVPYGWYTTDSHAGTASNPAKGNCDKNGIVGVRKKVPVDTKGKPLCYKLTNRGLKSGAPTLSVMVAETCGGNCNPPPKDCPTLFGPSQYELKNRCYPTQKLPHDQMPSNYNINWDAATISGAGAPGPPPVPGSTSLPSPSPYHGCTSIPRPGVSPQSQFDWCGGYYSHFDLDRATAATLFGNPHDNYQVGLVEYSRIPC